ncbi:MAG: hypothetical protein K6E27_08865 [Eubacterium sp.]|nr:hypothetical protein [Eubacterium sp.]
MDNKTKIAQKMYKNVLVMLEEGHSPNYIYKNIVDSLGYTEDYQRRAFASCYGQTFLCYLKKIELVNAYEKWLKNGAKDLSTRTKVNNIKEFKRKFCKAFNITPEYARDNKIDIFKYVEELNESLEQAAWIEKLS